MASKPKPDFTGSVNDKAADAIFGAPSASPEPPGQPNQIAKPLSIFQIMPDPKQPRRQIPSVIRQQWNGDPQKIIELFAAWSEGFAEEVGREAGEIDNFIGMVLDGQDVSPTIVYQGDQVDPKRNWGVIGGSLMAVVNLAAEIRRDGLTNPITVVRGEARFLIETGERRWLAFHLLHIFYNASAAWTRIPAREMPASSVWRQAGENNVREPLNAISMARQLAILLMDLYGHGAFQSFYQTVEQWGAQSCDRVYYTQVADGNKWRIPRGKGEQLVNAMGIKNPQQLRNYRDLLRLPDEVWTLADDLNWTEYFIRAEIVDKAVNESGMIALAQFHADAAGYRVTDSRHTVSVDTVSDEVEGEHDAQVDQEAALHGEEDAIFGDTGSASEPNEPAGNAGEDDDEPVVDSALEFWQVQALEDAYKRAAEGNPWFAAKDSPSGIDRLNQLVNSHLLRGRTAYANTYFDAAFYAISGQGCAAIGRPYVATPLPERKPVSGGEHHAGNGTTGAGTPPVQGVSQTERQQQQAKLERKILDQVEEFKKQFAFAAEKINVQAIQNQQANSDANALINQIEAELRKFRNRLNGK